MKLANFRIDDAVSPIGIWVDGTFLDLHNVYSLRRVAVSAHEHTAEFAWVLADEVQSQTSSQVPKLPQRLSVVLRGLRALSIAVRGAEGLPQQPDCLTEISVLRTGAPSQNSESLKLEFYGGLTYVCEADEAIVDTAG